MRDEDEEGSERTVREGGIDGKGLERVCASCAGLEKVIGYGRLWFIY